MCRRHGNVLHRFMRFTQMYLNSVNLQDHQSCVFKPVLSSILTLSPCSLSVFLSFLARKHPLTPFNTVLCSAQPQSNSAKNSIVTSPKGNVPSPALVFTSLFLSVLFSSDSSVSLASFSCLTHVCLCQRLVRLRPPVVDAVCLSQTWIQAHLHLCHRNNVNVLIDEFYNPDLENFDASFMFSQRRVLSVCMNVVFFIVWINGRSTKLRCWLFVFQLVLTRIMTVIMFH